MIYGSPTVTINQRRQVYRDGRFFSSEAAAEKYAQTPPSLRSRRRTIRTQTSINEIQIWLRAK